MSSPSSATVRSGALRGRSDAIACRTVLLPASRGTAITMKDLRYGRGAGAPAWVAKYADALCMADVDYVAQHTDASLGMTDADIKAQFARMHDNGLDCSGVRYLGAVGDRQFVFALRQGN